MERKFREDRKSFAEKQKLSKEEKNKRRRDRFRKVKNAVALVAVATTITAAEYALASQIPYQKAEPSCADSPFQIDCTWNPVTPTPIKVENTHVSVPEHEVAPNVNQHIR
ncbi:MAG TPA: hypothetical protein VF189_03355 [Patescibacteria group bacterium]